jgi:hypothetical protein
MKGTSSFPSLVIANYASFGLSLAVICLLYDGFSHRFLLHFFTPICDLVEVK